MRVGLGSLARQLLETNEARDGDSGRIAGRQIERLDAAKPYGSGP